MKEERKMAWSSKSKRRNEEITTHSTIMQCYLLALHPCNIKRIIFYAFSKDKKSEREIKTRNGSKIRGRKFMV